MAIERANVAGLLCVHVGARRVADVLPEPHGAERFLQSIHVIPAASSSATVPLPLSLALLVPPAAAVFPWGPHNLKAALDPHDVVPVVVLVLQPPCCLQIHVESLSQEACVKAAEDVAALTPLLALLTAAKGLESALSLAAAVPSLPSLGPLLVLVLRVASEEESLKTGERRTYSLSNLS